MARGYHAAKKLLKAIDGVTLVVTKDAGSKVGSPTSTKGPPKMARTNGYTLRERIRELSSRVEVSAKAFNESFFVFPGEKKPSPLDASKELQNAEEQLAIAQSDQQKFNLLVSIDVMGTTMSLAQGVKLLGGIGRIEKGWRSSLDTKNRYGYNDLTRSANEIRAERAVPMNTIIEQAGVSARYASALRAAVAKGNAAEVDISEFRTPVSAR